MSGFLKRGRKSTLSPREDTERRFCGWKMLPVIISKQRTLQTSCHQAAIAALNSEPEGTGRQMGCMPSPQPLQLPARVYPEGLRVGKHRTPKERKWKSLSHVQSLRLMDCSLPGSSVYGILQARILEWVAIPFFRGSSQLRDLTQVSHIAGKFFTDWATPRYQRDDFNMSGFLHLPYTEKH